MRQLTARNRNLNRAITLVEVIVVIAIIAVIAAITFPVMARVKANARSAVCIANLKQLGVAMHLYSDSNAGYLPPFQTERIHALPITVPPESEQWVQAYLAYGMDKSQFFCPVDRYRGGPTPQPSDTADAVHTSYTSRVWTDFKKHRWPDLRPRIQLSDPPNPDDAYAQDRIDASNGSGPLNPPQTGHGAWVHYLSYHGAVKGVPIPRSTF